MLDALAANPLFNDKVYPIIAVSVFDPSGRCQPRLFEGGCGFCGGAVTCRGWGGGAGGGGGCVHVSFRVSASH